MLKGLQFTQISQENIQRVVQSVYDHYYDTLWFKQSQNENEIKQSIYDKINHPGVISQSYICIEQNFNNQYGTVVAAQFCCDLQNYLSNNHKWYFHPHMYLIEKTVELVSQNLSQEELQSSLWGFWSFNLREDSQPEILDVLFSKIMTQCVLQGYKNIYSFEQSSMEGHADDNLNELVLQPVINNVRKAFRYTTRLHSTLSHQSQKRKNQSYILRKRLQQKVKNDNKNQKIQKPTKDKIQIQQQIAFKEQDMFFEYIDGCFRWVNPQFRSLDKQQSKQRLKKLKSQVVIEDIKMFEKQKQKPKL